MSKIDWSTPKAGPWAEYRDKKIGKSETKWDYNTDTITTTTTTGTTGTTWITSATFPSSYSTGGLVYITDGNSYSVTTDDGTTVELDAKGNCIKVNGYKITTEAIKNAIKKIQEEEK